MLPELNYACGILTIQVDSMFAEETERKRFLINTNIFISTFIIILSAKDFVDSVGSWQS
jgi:hypothetical protein